jgi:hypothetical protein
MKNIFFSCVALTFNLLLGCTLPKNKIPQKLTVDLSLLDSIKKTADTTYAKRYPRTDITLAEYYINRKDSSSTQVMKDSLNTIRQIIVVKNKTRIYTAQFYANGQLMAQYRLDSFGQYEGTCKEFFENGSLKREGIYKSGFHFGKWKSYDSSGNLILTDEYNKDGAIIHNN